MTMKLIFQMACILHPECNFLHGYFRCPTTCGDGRHRSQSEDNAGYSHVQKEQDIPGNQV